MRGTVREGDAPPHNPLDIEVHRSSPHPLPRDPPARTLLKATARATVRPMVNPHDPTTRLLASLAARVRAHAAAIGHPLPERCLPEQEVEPLEPSAHPAFAHAARAWGLSAWELDLLRLAIAADLDADFATAWAHLQDGSPHPTVHLAMAVHAIEPAMRPHALASLLSHGPLRRLGLLTPTGAPLTQAHLHSADGLWGRLAGLPHVAPVVPVEPVHPGLSALVLDDAVATSAGHALALARRTTSPAPLLMIVGEPGSGRDAVARALAGELGRPTMRVEADRLQQPQLSTALRRDARWWGAAVLVIGGLDAADPVLDLDVPVLWVLTPGNPVPIELADRRPVARVQVRRPTHATRAAVWRSVLGDDAERLDAGAMAHHHRLGPGRIAEAVRRARQRHAHLDEECLATACREVASAGFGELAQALVTTARWHDLVVSDAVRSELALAESWLNHGSQVFQNWGMGRALTGSIGLVALFAGPPGTGKTLAARVLARELGLQLWRVDLSRTVDKFIGETEKNLGRIFDAAREGNVMLLFDEADAVFGRRTDVRDAHDRYANLETGYLLQRLEEHDGPIILASNLPQNLDNAFQRRIHVIARFDLPDATRRRAIWDLHLPPAPHRGDDLDLDLLARSPAAGGDIRNATLTAALLAAPEGTVVSMGHAVRGLARELRKSGRIVDPGAFGPWHEHARS